MHGHTMPGIAILSYLATCGKWNAVKIGILHVKMVVQCQK